MTESESTNRCEVIFWTSENRRSL